jgi:hypothetical protein
LVIIRRGGVEDYGTFFEEKSETARERGEARGVFIFPGFLVRAGLPHSLERLCHQAKQLRGNKEPRREERG